MPPAWPVAQGLLELVLAAVRVLARGAPAIHVHLRDRLAVELDGELAAPAGHHRRVPLPGGPDGLFAGRNEVVDGTAVMGARVLAAMGVEDLDLDAGVD